MSSAVEPVILFLSSKNGSKGRVEESFAHQKLSFISAAGAPNALLAIPERLLSAEPTARESFLFSSAQRLRLIERESPADIDPLAITVAFDARQGTFIVEVPRTTPHQLFYRKTEQGLAISRRPESLAGSLSPSEQALFELLQFGAIFPTHSLWDEVDRFVPGYRYRLSFSSDSLDLRREPLPSRLLDSEISDTPLDEILLANVRDSLSRAAAKAAPIVLFSGGVDSGFLASELVELGYGETQLVHLSFDPQGTETKNAREMARRLGLPLDIISFNRNSAFESLISARSSFHQPFGDISVLPTAQLMSEISARYDKTRPIIDGTGADGSFGRFKKYPFWRALSAIPSPAAKLGGLIYALANLAGEQGRLEQITRILRRFSQYELIPAAVMAQNALSDISYFFSKDVQEHSRQIIQEYFSELASDEPLSAFIGANLIYVCANIYGQKTTPFRDGLDSGVIYPFLNPELVDHLLSTGHKQLDFRAEEKAFLKQRLASRVGEDLVYRPKVGFDPVGRDIFIWEPVEELLDLAVKGGPLAPYLDKTSIVHFRRRLHQGYALNAQAYNFLWVLAFSALWFQRQDLI